MILFCKERRGQVSVTGIGKQCRDGFAFVFGTLCKGYSSVQDCAGGNADKHTFLGCDESACRKSILVRNGDDFVIDFGIQYLRNKASADSLNFVRAGSAGG